MNTSTHAYADSKSKTLKNEYFAKAFVAFNTLWKRQRLMYLGLDKDIFQARIFAVYQDPENPCSVVTTVFPGQPIHYGAEDFDQDGCLDLPKWFGPYWDKTING